MSILDTVKEVGERVARVAAEAARGVTEARQEQAQGQQPGPTSSTLTEAQQEARAHVVHASFDQGASSPPGLFAFGGETQAIPTVTATAGAAQQTAPPAEGEDGEVRQEVIDAVDGQIAPEATPDQRQRAYRIVQEYVDDVGGVGDAGIVEEALPRRAGQLLRENGIPTQITDLESAVEVVDRDFTVFDTAKQGDPGDADGEISREDLETVLRNEGGRFTAEQQRAAEFLLASEASRSFLDVGAGRGDVDGTISREDVDAARETLRSGAHLDELLDTAAGEGGRDGHVGEDDIVAALADPGIPQEQKNAIRLLLLDSAGGEDLHAVLEGLTPSEVAAASALYDSAEFRALSDDEKQLVAAAVRDSGGSSLVTRELQGLIDSPEFRSGTAAERTAALSEIALFNSTEFRALPGDDQDRVRAALANAGADDLDMAPGLLSLVTDGEFQALDGAERTAVLSQVSNYPDSLTVHNIERLLQKGWFQDQSLEDKQRSLKLVAHLSVHEDGDPAVVQNTLDRFLAADSDYELRWDAIAASGGNITFGRAGGDTLTLNSNLVAADNNAVGGGNEARVIENTTAHEVNHLVNDDDTDQTFEYLNEEYRAWYVGYLAEHGEPPSNQEAMDRWEYFLNPNGGYADYSHGIERDWWFDTDGALDKSEEAEQIFDLLSQLSGLDVDAGNYRDVMADPGSWTTDPNAPAAAVPPGDRDN